MRAAIVAALLLAAACQREPAGTQQTAPATAPGTVSGISHAGDRLSGSTSALTADTSGLMVRVTDTARIVELATDTLFAFDSAKLEPGAEPNLLRTAELIRQAPAGDLRIVGHTDAKGADDYNQTLSQQRAEAVATWLRQQVGVRQRTIAAEGKGETAPIAPNTRPDGSDDPDGRAKNRRVEVVIPR